jgi:hypothetical protein
MQMLMVLELYIVRLKFENWKICKKLCMLDWFLVKQSLIYLYIIVLRLQCYNVRDGLPGLLNLKCYNGTMPCAVVKVTHEH